MICNTHHLPYFLTTIHTLYDKSQAIDSIILVAINHCRVDNNTLTVVLYNKGCHSSNDVCFSLLKFALPHASSKKKRAFRMIPNICRPLEYSLPNKYSSCKTFRSQNIPHCAGGRACAPITYHTCLLPYVSYMMRNHQLTVLF